MEQPYNPLEKLRLAESVVSALLNRQAHALPPDVSFQGAGIYAIYYVGAFEAYRPMTEQNRHGLNSPIYVGKAVPPGGRQGGFGLSSRPTSALFSRLNQHASSINDATNLHISDFLCRYLVVDDIWIPLAENLLIDRYKPLWNVCVSGFGNHDQGATRVQARRSAWDTLHEGRAWATRFQPHGQTVDQILTRISEFFSRPDIAAAATDEYLSSEDDSGIV